MKKILSAMLAGLMLLSLFGCSLRQEYRYPVNFYYLRHENSILYSEPDGVITCEVREAGREDLKNLLNLYFQGPVDETLASPFPPGLQVISVYNDHGLLELKLSDHFSVLSGLDLSLACACIAKTCLSIDGINAVNLKVNDESAEASRTIILTEDAIKYSDDTDLSALPASE